MPGLSCSTQGIFLSFFFVFFFFFFSCGMQNLAHCLTEGLYQGSLHWECEVLATEPPGKSLSQVFLPGIWRPSLPLKGSTTELHPLSGTSSRRVAVPSFITLLCSWALSVCSPRTAGQQIQFLLSVKCVRVLK